MLCALARAWRAYALPTVETRDYSYIIHTVKAG